MELVTQRPSYYNCCILFYMSYVIYGLSCYSDLCIFAIAYTYCDYWLYILHIFFDDFETTKNTFQLLRNTSRVFQEHHSRPHDIIHLNHVSDIDGMIMVCFILALTYMYMYPTDAYGHIIYKCIYYVGICGIFASINHYYCHANIYIYKIKKITFQFTLFRFLQNIGGLPTPVHHMKHHVPPHDCNWNMLNGNYKLMMLCGRLSHRMVKILFYTTNPIIVSLAIYLSLCFTKM
jgi:hypothetical protein